jgi:hypothetical protein
MFDYCLRHAAIYRDGLRGFCSRVRRDGNRKLRLVKSGGFLGAVQVGLVNRPGRLSEQHSHRKWGGQTGSGSDFAAGPAMEV